MTIFDPLKLTGKAPNNLSFGGLDRDVTTRNNDDCLNMIIRNPQTRVVPVWCSRNLFSEIGGDLIKPIPSYLNTDEAIELINISKNQVYLGKETLKEIDIPYLAIDISSLNEDKAKSKLESKGKFADLREISPLIDGIAGSILAYARAIIFWHSINGFCSECGASTITKKGGHQRNCTNAKCNSLHFPRTDPAVIMLVQNEDKVLLGRQKIWPEGLYSTLAGFVEPGETIEHAVAREVYEESGIIVKNVTYQHSQPWPFPSSLMLGFTAEAQTKNIKYIDSEIEDAQWFSRDDILNFENQKKFLPRRLSVSRRLIEDWLNLHFFK